MTITTSAELEMFIIYLGTMNGVVTGSIDINYPTITQAQLTLLLNSVVSISDTLTIQNIRTSLQITGSTLVTAKNISIINNRGLTSISGFNSLTKVTVKLNINNNRNLKQIIGFAKLNTAPTIYINKLSVDDLRIMTNLKAAQQQHRYYYLIKTGYSRPKASKPKRPSIISALPTKVSWSCPKSTPPVTSFYVYKDEKLFFTISAVTANTKYSITGRFTKKSRFHIIAMNSFGSTSSTVAVVK
jgi:hypothetical protein